MIISIASNCCKRLHLIQGLHRPIKNMAPLHHRGAILQRGQMFSWIGFQTKSCRNAAKTSVIICPRRPIKAHHFSSDSSSNIDQSRPALAKQSQQNSNISLDSANVKRLLEFAKPERWSIAGGVGCLILSSAITMSVPFGLGKILDVIYSSSVEAGLAKEKLDQFCLLLAGVFALGGLANFGRIYLFSNASLRITQSIRSTLYNAMLKNETGWFDKKGTGELVNRLSSDTFLVGNSLSMNLSDGLRSTAMVLAGTGMMVYTSPHLALVGICIVPCVAGMAIGYGRYLRNISRLLTDKQAEVMKLGEEKLSNIKTVKIFCKEKFENQLFSDRLLDALTVGYREAKARAVFYGMTGLSGNIIILSVLYYGGTMVNNSEMTIGALTSFILYAGYTAISIGGLSNFYTEINKGIGSASRIWEIVDRKPAIPTEGGLMLQNQPKGEVVFDSVGYNYPSRPDAVVLSNLNLRVEPESITAVVGRSGSGKSTMASLLLRLYDPQAGNIFLDGQNLKDLNSTSLRRHIGAVNQEPVLFSGSIRENILYGLNLGDKVSESDFQRAVHEAHVHEFAKHLPDGLNTLVGQRGIMLSGGQKQRVAIARAIIRNPRILILDEATSALDAVSEELIQKSLEHLTRNRTVLIIAHRLSTIRNATNIAVLQNGKIVEHGNYSELFKVNEGVFKELVQRQTFSLSS
ncbi:ATP-binding cassette sub-family B member 10, mitochondrial [Toxorhynchites rutilus septentrionalis]|uniref:ATP-binding cassette sub-family B member 10, mitochondrial n=1 Tax=Toxorhynchites rutilus septentrionalis TaxID=329112 RepID=UPI00247AF04E|nr:ATP-binding cassette sub-family B member 10, mitochondrial [Toxorhynchites rutilus septentrionalis]